MKIAIILAIFVIFVSGTYAVFDEEPVPNLIFEGGEYKIYRGNVINVPVKVEVENHDHTVLPNLITVLRVTKVRSIEIGYSFFSLSYQLISISLVISLQGLSLYLFRYFSKLNR